MAFPPVPSSTIFWKQRVMVVCMISLAQLPSALTRLRGCCPRALLAPAVRRGEGLLLPNGPWTADGERWERGGHQRLGPPPPFPGVAWLQSGAAPGGMGPGGRHGFPGGVPAWTPYFRSHGLLLQSHNWEIFISTLPKSFCSERFQVKCVSAHFSWEGRFTYALGSFYQNTHRAMTHLIDNVLSDG